MTQVYRCVVSIVYLLLSAFCLCIISSGLIPHCNMSLSGMGSTGFPGFGAEATGAKLTNFTSASVTLSSDPACLPNWYPSGSLSSVMSGQG